MQPKEPTCAFNLRKFPRELRKRLRKIAIDLDEDVQDVAPRWLRERVEQEERKLTEQGKPIAKRKVT
jgi:hypothetical protein